jgi:cyclopropane fatty-acyl-phospholipid synthase-like methyltransferase
MNLSMLKNLGARPDAARALENYRHLASGYDSTCTRIESLRQRAVRELKLRGGETVFDIGCGTGATLPLLASAVGPTGKVVGIELSPEMAALAQRRVDAAALRASVEVIESALDL